MLGQLRSTGARQATARHLPRSRNRGRLQQAPDSTQLPHRESRLTTPQASRHATDRIVAPLTGLCRWVPAPPVSRRHRQPATGPPGSYPDRTPGRRRRATNTKIHHGTTSRCYLQLCWAHEKIGLITGCCVVARRAGRVGSLGPQPGRRGRARRSRLVQERLNSAAYRGLDNCLVSADAIADGTELEAWRCRSWTRQGHIPPRCMTTY